MELGNGASMVELILHFFIRSNMQYIDNHDLASKGYILVNKLNISDYNQLLTKEEEISKTKMIDMFKTNHFANKDVVNLECLQEIHYIEWVTKI